MQTKIKSYFLVITMFSLVSLNVQISLADLDCRLINCDCENLDFGIITRPYREECRATEAKIKELCEAGTKAVSCHSTAAGPNAWPMGNDGDHPDVAKSVDNFASNMKGMSTYDKSEYYSQIRPQILALADYEPGLFLVDHYAQGVFSSHQALQDFDSALYTLQDPGAPVTQVDPEAAKQAAQMMVSVVTSLDKKGAENPTALYAYAKWAEKTTAGAISLSELIGTNTDNLKTIEKGFKWVRAASSADDMRTAGDVDAKRFVDDIINIVPPTASPALASPVAKFFRDLLSWDQKMWNNTTQGLNLVSNAIETGNLDQAQYRQVSMNLEKLGQEGPWTKQTGWDVVKKTAEQIPVLGKLIKALSN